MMLELYNGSCRCIPFLRNKFGVTAGKMRRDTANSAHKERRDGRSSTIVKNVKQRQSKRACILNNEAHLILALCEVLALSGRFCFVVDLQSPGFQQLEEPWRRSIVMGNSIPVPAVERQ